MAHLAVSHISMASVLGKEAKVWVVPVTFLSCFISLLVSSQAVETFLVFCYLLKSQH